MEIETILGHLLGGFATKIYAGGAAVYVAAEASSVFGPALQAVSQTLNALP